MRHFRTGEFDRTKVSRFHRRFSPAHAAESLHQVDLQKLWDGGKRLICVDVDHTLVKWGLHEASEPVVEWINEARGMGFDICIISNTHNLERLEKIRSSLGVATVRGKFKPSRAMFRLAMIKFQRRPEETIMIGDQLLTDVFGANRSGIDAIWVRKMEGKEFGGTRINRMVESFLTGGLYEALIAPVDERPDAPGVEGKKRLKDRAIVHQLIKFAVVGGTSFVIDYCIRMTLMFSVPWSGGLASEHFGRALHTSMPSLFPESVDLSQNFVPFARGIAAAIAMVNSFFLNRMWTFKIRGREERMGQLKRFLVISIGGWLINVSLTTLFNHMIPGEAKAALRIATILAAVVAAGWNFLGQRLYAFRTKAK